MLRRPLLVAAGLALLVGTRGSSGATPARNGRIAFDHVGLSGSSAIYTVTSQGTRRRLLTPRSKTSSRSPSYSPDGRRIVFVRAYKQGELWTMRPDGSRQRRLTHTNTVDETDPAWSPDGKGIVFTVDRPAAQEGIWVMGSDGRHRRRLTNGVDANPAWSPDGSEIAFDRTDALGQFFGIWVVPAGGGTPTDLSSEPGISDRQPAWSPDGSRILFSSDRPDTFRLDLWTMNAQGSDTRQVTDTPGLDENDPAWSPDGRWIAYVGTSHSHGSASYQVYVSRPNGTKRHPITHACGLCTIINDDPSWQPLR